MTKVVDYIGALIGLPFIIIGWLVSIVVIGFLIGYESFQYGELKKNLLSQNLKVIDSLSKQIAELKKEKE